MKILILIILTTVASQLVQAGIGYQDGILGTLHKNIEINSDSLVTINNKTYFISNNNVQVDVETAMLLCNDAGMSLLSLETEEEYLAVNDYLVDKGDINHVYWTSGRPISRSVYGNWFWSGSGQMFTYVNWLSGEPSEGTCDMCVSLTAGLGYADDACSISCSFICETN